MRNGGLDGGQGARETGGSPEIVAASDWGPVPPPVGDEAQDVAVEALPASRSDDAGSVWGPAPEPPPPDEARPRSGGAVHLVFVRDGKASDIVILWRFADATVGELRVALGLPFGAVLFLDGRRLDPETTLVEEAIVDGSVLSTPGPEPAPAPVGPVELATTAGLDAGRREHLGPAPIRLGGATVALAENGAEVVVTVDGSPTRAALDVPVRVGGLEVVARRGDNDDRTTPAPRVERRRVGSVPINRPPRSVPQEDPSEVPAPAPPPKPTPAGNIATLLVSLLVPLLSGLAIAAFTRTWISLVFAISAVVAAPISYLFTKRAHRAAEAAAKAEFSDQLRRFRERLAGRGRDARERAERMHPDPAEVVRRAELPSYRLWERRAGDPDAFCLRVGRGTLPWTPPARSDAPEASAIIEHLSSISMAPITVSLSDGSVGICGAREATLAVARQMVLQTCVLHGPADVSLVAFVGDHAEWDWLKWLPHVRRRDGGGLAMVGAEDFDETAETLLQGVEQEARRAEQDPITLCLVDGAEAEWRTDGNLRRLLRNSSGHIRAIVVAPSHDRVPGFCSSTVDVSATGVAEVTTPSTGRLSDVLAAGCSTATVTRAARALARHEDPDLVSEGGRLPDGVGLLDLLRLPDVTAKALKSRWDALTEDPPLFTPIGMSDKGIEAIDLVADGPHGLLAGSTGSGKSELLRSLVGGLAAMSPPEALSLLLIDFKGGSAFRPCAGLPHTVRVVTNLEGPAAERALVLLGAELAWRQRFLRDEGDGAESIEDYRKKRPLGPPLPRLVVVIDEFGELKQELPDFDARLNNIARIGRSLGVHLILSTQNPSASVTDTIAANAPLRMSLRVQNSGESTAMIGSPDATSIPQTRPGRARIKRADGRVPLVQTAFSGTQSGTTVVPVDIGEFVPANFGGAWLASKDSGGRTDLQKLVVAATGAAEKRPRSKHVPWLDPLPHVFDLESLDEMDLPDAKDAVPVAIVDNAFELERLRTGWAPAQGNLVLLGELGSGVTTTAVSIVLAECAAASPEDVNVHLVCFGGHDLVALEPLPHVGSVVRPGSNELLYRLLRHLSQEVADREETAVNRPRTFLVIDGYGSVRTALEAKADPTGKNDPTSWLRNVYERGPAVGVHTVLGADRVSQVPGFVREATRQRWIFRIAETGDAGQLGIRHPGLDSFDSGRGIAAELGRAGLEIQVGKAKDVGRWIAACSNRWRTSRSTAFRARPLPDRLLSTDLPPAELTSDGEWTIPVGWAARDLEPVVLAPEGGNLVVVAGPADAGRSAVLAGLAQHLRRTVEGLRLISLGRRATVERLRALIGPPITELDTADDRWGVLLSGERTMLGPTVLVIDDAQTVEDAHLEDRTRAIDGLRTLRPDVLVLAGATHGGLGSNLDYDHWLRSGAKGSRTGILLWPSRSDPSVTLLGVESFGHTFVAMDKPARGFAASSGAALPAQFIGV